MKKLTLFIIVTIPFICFGQVDSLMDVRDGQYYLTTKINNTIWMLDNLNFETELSYSLDAAQQNKRPNFNGRWYHLDEVKSVCPSGWQIPSAIDWLDYFKFLTAKNNSKLKITSGKESVALTGFDNKVNLFDSESPLHIRPTGIFQGSNYVLEEMADYWISDIPTVRSLDNVKEFKKQNFQPIKIVFEGKSHIHLYNKFTQIHSHDHHLDPAEEESLRRFMIRCVSYLNN